MVFAWKTLTYESIEKLTQPLYMTEEEFVKFCDEDTKPEYIDREGIVHSPVSNKHSRLASFLSNIIQFCVDQHKFGTIWARNFQVQPRPGLRRAPDLIFVASENQRNITNTEVDGPPDLVAQIFSSHDVERDWRLKYLKYEKAGIDVSDNRSNLSKDEHFLFERTMPIRGSKS